MRKTILPAIAAFFLAFSLAGAFAEGGLPEDTPVKYPALTLETEKAEGPDISADAPTPEDDEAARPGESDQGKQNTVIIQMKNTVEFASPLQPGYVGIVNPADSTVTTQYFLRISLRELLNTIGRSGYGDEAYAALSAEPGFDPATSYIVLSQTQGVAPGYQVEYMTLGTLPDGSTLPAGTYAAQYVMAACDAQTGARSLVSAIVDVTLIVKTDAVTLDITDGAGALSVFNPVSSAENYVYKIVISQKELEKTSGSPHRTQEELAAQAEDSTFDAAREFIPLFESTEVKPGEFIEGGVVLEKLPDGQSLPQGTYKAWLVRYALDETLNTWHMLDARTEITLNVR